VRALREGIACRRISYQAVCRKEEAHQLGPLVSLHSSPGRPRKNLLERHHLATGIESLHQCENRRGTRVGLIFERIVETNPRHCLSHFVDRCTSDVREIVALGSPLHEVKDSLRANLRSLDDIDHLKNHGRGHHELSAGVERDVVAVTAATDLVVGLRERRSDAGSALSTSTNA
jgi:hypothetical protein